VPRSCAHHRRPGARADEPVSVRARATAARPRRPEPSGASPRVHRTEPRRSTNRDRPHRGPRRSRTAHGGELLRPPRIFGARPRTSKMKVRRRRRQRAARRHGRGDLDQGPERHGHGYLKTAPTPTGVVHRRWFHTRDIGKLGSPTASCTRRPRQGPIIRGRKEDRVRRDRERALPHPTSSTRPSSASRTRSSGEEVKAVVR